MVKKTNFDVVFDPNTNLDCKDCGSLVNGICFDEGCQEMLKEEKREYE